MSEIKVLATDMDGTFIPLENHQQNRFDLSVLVKLLSQQSIDLVYVTGRHFELAMEAIASEQLPNPSWMICDVGTSIYHQNGSGKHERVESYSRHLAERVGRYDVSLLHAALSKLTGLRKQESEKQGPFKLSYYCVADHRDAITESILAIVDEKKLPYHVVSSVDPFTDDGLIDLMPVGVNKAYALSWWAQTMGFCHKSLMFSGDSGNDLAALCEGYNSIIVANSPDQLGKQVRDAHRERGYQDRLFIAESVATSGVLEGVKHFLSH